MAVGGPAVSGGYSALLAPDLRRVVIETGKERPLEYPLLFNVSDAEWRDVTDQQMTGLGSLQSKPEGSPFTLDRPQLGSTKTYSPDIFALGFEVTWEMWRDELYGTMRGMARELMRASRYRQETEAWDLLNRAFNTAEVGFTASESLCSTSHAAVGDGGAAQANRPNPDVGFGVTYIQGAITRFENLNNERGLPQLMAPVMAVVAPENKFVARAVLGSSGAPYTADNEINGLVQEDMAWMVTHYLTTTTYAFLVAAKGVHDLNWIWRDRPIFDSYDDPRTKNAVFTMYQRHTRGFSSWRGIDGTTG